jgi:hypothetical protein
MCRLAFRKPELALDRLREVANLQPAPKTILSKLTYADIKLASLIDYFADSEELGEDEVAKLVAYRDMIFEAVRKQSSR